jgi:hypothetical protein
MCRACFFGFLKACATGIRTIDVGRIRYESEKRERLRQGRTA